MTALRDLLVVPPPRRERPAVARLLAESRARGLQRCLNGVDLSPMRICDLGAGSGGFLDLLVRAGAAPASVTAIDVDRRRLGELRRRHPEVHVVRADARERSDLPRQCFDLVVVSQVLSQNPCDGDRTRIVENAIELLADSGRLLVHDMRLLRPRTRRAGLRRFTRKDLRLSLPADFRVSAATSCVLAPPILRLLAPLGARVIIGLETAAPFLRGHWMAVVERGREG